MEVFTSPHFQYFIVDIQKLLIKNTSLLFEMKFGTSRFYPNDFSRDRATR